MAEDKKLRFGEEVVRSKPQQEVLADALISFLNDRSRAGKSEKGTISGWDRLRHYYEHFKVAITHVEDVAERIAELQNETPADELRYLETHDPFSKIRDEELHSFLTNVLLIRTLGRMDQEAEEPEFGSLAMNEGAIMIDHFAEPLQWRDRNGPTLHSFLSAYLVMHRGSFEVTDVPVLIPQYPPSESHART